MLIGDLYAMSARNCGDEWNKGLAVLAALEKYDYAKNIDSKVEFEANKRIGVDNPFRPEESLASSKEIKEGDKVLCKCWINEIVTVKFK